MDTAEKQTLISLLVEARAEIQIHAAHELHDIRGRGKTCYQCDLSERLNERIESLRK